MVCETNLTNAGALGVMGNANCTLSFDYGFGIALIIILIMGLVIFELKRRSSNNN